MVIKATGTDDTAIACQVTIVFFIRHLFNKEIQKQVAGAKSIQTLGHAMTLAQESEIKFKKYEGLNGDDISVMQISSIPQSESVVMAI